MAGTTLMPSRFSGLSSENAEQWLNDVTNYCAYKKLDDPGKIGLIPLLLKDAARCWFDILDAGSKDSFDHLSAAFKEHYKPPAITRWKEVSLVWDLIQKHDQPVEQFISQVQQQAIKAKLNEEQLRYSILHGLLPELRRAVINHEPATLDDIRKWATIAESAGMERKEDSNSKLEKAITRLENKFDNLQAAAADNREPISNSSKVRFSDQARARSPSPTHGNQRHYDQAPNQYQ